MKIYADYYIPYNISIIQYSMYQVILKYNVKFIDNNHHKMNTLKFKN